MQVIWVIYKIPDKNLSTIGIKERKKIFLLTLFLPGKINGNEKKCMELYQFRILLQEPTIKPTPKTRLGSGY